MSNASEITTLGYSAPDTLKINGVEYVRKEKTITINEKQFDETWGKYSELDRNHEDMKQDIKKDLWF